MSEFLTPVEALARDVAGGFTADSEQTALAQRLTALRTRLIEAGEVPNGLSRLFRRREPVPGLYLWGGVGRGKTYLMDLFHQSLPFADKSRLHFHRFMQRVCTAICGHWPGGRTLSKWWPTASPRRPGCSASTSSSSPTSATR